MGTIMIHGSDADLSQAELTVLKASALDSNDISSAEHEEDDDVGGSDYDVGIMLVMEFENVDYDMLTADPALRSRFEAAVKDATAGKAGQGTLPEHVRVDISKGSVRALVSVTPPPGVDTNGVESTLANGALAA